MLSFDKNSAQSVFNHVVNHLREQEIKSKDPHDRCMYRGKLGTMCAVGCLISDDEYDVKMEHKTVSYVVNHYECLNWMGKHSSLLGRLQECHDYIPIIDWEMEFKDIAKEFDLTIP